MILRILKNIYHSFYHEKIWKDYYKMRAQFSLLNDEAPSKGEEKKCIHRSHENGKREILLEKISPFYLCCLQDMSLSIYKHFKTMLMFIVSYIHIPLSINGVTSSNKVVFFSFQSAQMCKAFNVSTVAFALLLHNAFCLE